MIKKILFGLTIASLAFGANEARFPKGIIGNLQGSATTITGSLVPGNVPNNFVTNAQLQNMPAHTLKGNNTGGSSSPADLTGAQATAELSPFVGDTGFGGTKGLVPAPAIGDATKCLGGNGLWTTCGGGGGGGGGTASTLEALEQKNANEHFGIVTDALDNSVGSGFLTQPGSYYVQGRLMDTVTAGTATVVPVWSPKVLRDADANLDSTTNWVAYNAGAGCGGGYCGAFSLTTSGTHKIGTSSLQFSASAGGSSGSRILYDAGSAILNISGFEDHWVFVNLSSVTGVSAVTADIGDFPSNYREVTATAQFDGSALVVGWNLLHFDFSNNGGVNVGTGWQSSLPFRYYAIGITTPSIGSAVTVLVDSLFFSIYDPTKFVQPGSAISLYDDTHRENAVLATSNGAVTGAIQLLANAGQTYSGGIGTSKATLARSTLAVGNAQAAMTTTDQWANAVTGEAAYAQESRLARIFRTSLSGVDLHASFDVNTSQIYRVGSTTGSSVFLDDPSDTHLDLLNGETVHFFHAYASDGKLQFIHNGDTVLTGASYFNGATTAITAAYPAGTKVGDYVAKKVITPKFNIGAIGANETFATPFSTPNSYDDVQLFDNGLPVPNPNYVYGLWNLSGSAKKFLGLGVGQDLTLVGSPTFAATFKNNQFAATNFSGSNYLVATGSGSFVSAPATMSISIWYYPATFGATDYLLSTRNATNSGWVMYLSSGAVGFYGNTITLTGSALNLNNWNNIVLTIANGSSTKIYLNNALVATGAPNLTSGTDLYFGFDPVGGTGLNSASDRMAQVLVEPGVIFSDAQRAELFNSGMAQILGFGPILKYRANALGASGQACTLEGTLNRDTLNVFPFISKMGISP